MTNKSLTAERLRELVHYDLTTGVFRLRIRTPRREAGELAGSVHCRDGHIQLSLDGWPYRAHRVAWLYVYGEWPAAEIDHIDGDRCNNSIANLRAATRQQNQCNSRVRSHNRSGYKGVRMRCWGSRCKYEARIWVNHKEIYLGCFDSPHEAHSAYCKASDELHGTFGRRQ